MADEADMRNELADLQTRADQIADEVNFCLSLKPPHIASLRFLISSFH